MLTRKHFKSTAETLLKITDLKARRAVADEAVKYFTKENPRFDKARFLAACGL